MAIEREDIPTLSTNEVFDVSLDDAAEAGAWAMMLGCSAEALRQAVAAVGSQPERIREYLLATPATASRRAHPAGPCRPRR